MALYYILKACNAKNKSNKRRKRDQLARSLAHDKAVQASTDARAAYKAKRDSKQNLEAAITKPKELPAYLYRKKKNNKTLVDKFKGILKRG